MSPNGREGKIIRIVHSWPNIRRPWPAYRLQASSDQNYSTANLCTPVPYHDIFSPGGYPPHTGRVFSFKNIITSNRKRAATLQLLSLGTRILFADESALLKTFHSYQSPGLNIAGKRVTRRMFVLQRGFTIYVTERWNQRRRENQKRNKKENTHTHGRIYVTNQWRK